MSQEDRRRVDRAQPDEAAQQAERCRRLSHAVYDRTISEMLNRMAEDYDQRAGSDREA